MGNSQGTGDQVVSVGGKSNIIPASMLCSRIMWSIEEAERMLGQPPNTPQVVVVFQHNYTRRVNMSWLNAFLQNLYRADKFYADKQMLCWSC